MPEDIERTAEAHLTYVIVNWTAPTVTDNTETVTLTSDYNNTGSVFDIGVTLVTYTAIDAYGNVAEETFLVIVNRKCDYRLRKYLLTSDFSQDN